MTFDVEITIAERLLRRRRHDEQRQLNGDERTTEATTPLRHPVGEVIQWLTAPLRPVHFARKELGGRIACRERSTSGYGCPSLTFTSLPEHSSVPGLMMPELPPACRASLV